MENKEKFEIERRSIKQVMHKMEAGEYSIPKFQRNYVWDDKKTVELLRSIKRNFPIGILTAAQSKDANFKGKNEIIDSIIDTVYQPSSQIIIDGQQRLTSLVLVYFAFRIKNIKLDDKTQKVANKVLKNIFWYGKRFYSKKELSEKKFSNVKNTRERNKLMERYSISTRDNNAEIQEWLDKYVLHIMILKEWSSKQIIDIFGAINAGARPLTHVNLMNGMMYNISEDFSLTSFFNEINKNNIKNFGTIDDVLFVQLLKIYVDIKNPISDEIKVDYSKQTLLKFASNVALVKFFVKNKNNFIEELMKTIAYFEKEYSFNNIKSFPKNVFLLTGFASMLLSTEKNRKTYFNVIMKHISSRLISGEYSSGPGAKAQDDINHVLVNLYNQENPLLFEISEKDLDTKLIAQLSNLKYKNKNSAFFKLFISILIKKAPKYILTKNRSVPIKETIFNKTDIDRHHFIPTNSKSAKDLNIKDLTEKAANIVIITKDENRNKIRNKDLSEYLSKAKEIQGKEFETMLSSHYFDAQLINELLLIDQNETEKYKEKLRKIYSERIDSIKSEMFDTFFNGGY